MAETRDNRVARANVPGEAKRSISPISAAIV